MKKQLGILLALFFSGAVITNGNAQTSSASGFEAGLGAIKSQSHTNFSEDDILTSIQKKFKKQFTGITLESWTKTNGGYAVRFSAGTSDNLVFYDAKGNTTGQVRYYKPIYLPYDIRFQVESAYFNYDIFSVQEVIVEKSITYLIAIQAKKEWKIIRVSAAGMDVYKEYSKG